MEVSGPTRRVQELQRRLRGGVARATGSLRHALASRTVVLLYHRVTRLTVDPWSLSVTPEHFDEHLDVLERSYNPISLAEWLRASRDRGPPPRAVVVTFDDGYADNLFHALPAIEKHGIPATIFVVAGEDRTLFWWDELQRLMVNAQFESDRIVLRVRDQVHEFPTTPPAATSAGRAEAGRVGSYRRAWRLLRDLGAEERSAILADLAGQAVTAPNFRESHRRLTPAEIEDLHHSTLVEVGAHTLSHPFLPLLAAPEQHQEISSSKEALERLSGCPIRSFSYPFGGLSQKTVEIVRGAGYSCACTTHPTTARRGHDHFRLPRFPVADCDGDAFARHLDEAFAGRGTLSAAE